MNNNKSIELKKHRKGYKQNTVDEKWLSLHNIESPHTDLVLGELDGLGEVHVLHSWGGVPGGEGEAAQRVAPRPVVSDRRQDLILDDFSQRHFAVSNSDVRAPLYHSLWGALRERRGGMFNKSGRNVTGYNQIHNHV